MREPTSVPARRRRLPRVVAAAGATACVATAVALVVTPPASADAPVRTGWWNAASAGGSALPTTTAAGDLHVANAPSGPGAIAAVYYQLFTTPASATLELKVTPSSAVGTTAVMACPTEDASWKAGDDQPWSSAPAYSCTKHANGIVSADGTKVTFLLDEALALTPQSFSLALVPAPGAVEPFSVDFTKPGFDSLTVTENAAEPTTSGDTAPPAFTGTTTGGTTGTTTGAGPAPPPAPVSLPDAGSMTAPADTGGSAPVVATPPGSLPAATGLPVSPAAAATSEDRGRTLAILLLLALAVLLGRSTAMPPRQPQPLGRRRWATAGTDATAAAVVAVPPVLGGIGRFAKARTGPARPLI